MFFGVLDACECTSKTSQSVACGLFYIRSHQFLSLFITAACNEAKQSRFKAACIKHIAAEDEAFVAARSLFVPKPHCNQIIINEIVLNILPINDIW